MCNFFTLEFYWPVLLQLKVGCMGPAYKMSSTPLVWREKSRGEWTQNTSICTRAVTSFNLISNSPVFKLTSKSWVILSDSIQYHIFDFQQHLYSHTINRTATLFLYLSNQHPILLPLLHFQLVSCTHSIFNLLLSICQS